MVRAAGSTGGTVAVRRIRAIVAVSLGGTWGGEKGAHRAEQGRTALPFFQLPFVIPGALDLGSENSRRVFFCFLFFFGVGLGVSLLFLTHAHIVPTIHRRTPFDPCSKSL